MDTCNTDVINRELNTSPALDYINEYENCFTPKEKDTVNKKPFSMLRVCSITGIGYPCICPRFSKGNEIYIYDSTCRACTRPFLYDKYLELPTKRVINTVEWLLEGLEEEISV